MALVGPALLTTLSPRDLSSHCQEPHDVQREPRAGHKHGDAAVGGPDCGSSLFSTAPRPWPDKSEIWVRLSSFKPGSLGCPDPSPEPPFPVDLRTGCSQLGAKVMWGQRRLAGQQQERSRRECGCRGGRARRECWGFSTARSSVPPLG